MNPYLPPPLAFRHLLASREAFFELTKTHAAELAAQRAFETALAQGGPEFDFHAYCSACERVMPLRIDLQWGDGIKPNWRERLQCTCGLNNRVRAAFGLFRETIARKSTPRVYATEQVTALFERVRRLVPEAMGSEFLRDGTVCGRTNGAGIRHEDLTALTFPNESFDVVLSFDVLEHVPDYRACLRELARVLDVGGKLIASFPFNIGAAETVVRASLDASGAITHHLPPEYHGDPVSADGCLCFQVFGWSVLDEMRNAGFSDAHVLLYWSADHGHLGAHQLLITATR